MPPEWTCLVSVTNGKIAAVIERLPPLRITYVGETARLTFRNRITNEIVTVVLLSCKVDKRTIAAILRQFFDHPTPEIFTVNLARSATVEIARRAK